MPLRTHPRVVDNLRQRILTRSAVVGVIGLGYVGLPLCVEFARAGFRVVGLDLDPVRVASVNLGDSYISDVPSEHLRPFAADGRLRATEEYDSLAEVDVVVICVQTPFTATKEPDLRFVMHALEEITRRLRPGHLIVLQSTTYPGTTEEVALPLLAGSGLTVGQDYFLAFSPERVDPGNARFGTADIPKVVGGVTPDCTQLTRLLFEQIVAQVHPVGSARVAEMTKLLENIYRSVNIALVNELAILCERMGMDVWEIIDAAATKPFGFMRFLPGPGVGGHCIPVDPYYLSWKAKAYDFNTKFVALAAEINENMPYYVASRVIEAINLHAGRSVAGARILALGVSYKRDVGDVRESPALKVLEALRRRGALVSYHDAHVPDLRLGTDLLRSSELTDEALAGADCVLILTDHSGVDYQRVAGVSRLVFDTRNATRAVASPAARIIRL
ncbi:MAG: nucleotide sugar dehydrogenase [bacterium]